MSDEFTECFIDLMLNVERVGHWPTQIDGILIRLIEKVSGGYRPTGVQATFYTSMGAVAKIHSRSMVELMRQGLQLVLERALF